MGYTDKLHHCVTGTGSDTVPNTGPTPSESATTLDQTLAQYSQIFLLVTTNPNSSIRLPDRKARFVTPEKMPSLHRTGLPFTACTEVQLSSMLYTTACRFCIAFGGVRLDAAAQESVLELI